MKENKIQSDFYRWFNANYSAYRLLLFSIPNEAIYAGFLPKNISIRINNMLRSMGLVSGVADMFLSVARGGCHGLYLEFKTPKGTQSDKQKAFEERAKGQGYRYELVRSSEEAKEIVKEYLK